MPSIVPDHGDDPAALVFTDEVDAKRRFAIEEAEKLKPSCGYREMADALKDAHAVLIRANMQDAIDLDYIAEILAKAAQA